MSKYLDELLKSREFNFAHLGITGIDNSEIFKVSSPQLRDEENCLFHKTILDGDAYVDTLHEFVCARISDKKMAPVVRFADGEYAFYAKSLHCNGLYKQAESIKAIQRARPEHLNALKVLSETGILTPLIYSGNVRKYKKRLSSFLRRNKNNGSGSQFLDLLYTNNIHLTADNYIPFYVVYAYLTSKRFANLLNEKHICIINSDYNKSSCEDWFKSYSSHPRISYVEISSSYVATQWSGMRQKIFDSIPHDTSLCLVGAGIGSLLVCVDVAKEFGIPAIDAGHVLNMLNDRVDKSSGARLFTTWQS